jgi:hypothetical protein
VAVVALVVVEVMIVGLMVIMEVKVEQEEVQLQVH